jgi:hypothetical protein
MNQGGILIAKEERGTKAKPWNAATALYDHYFLENIITLRQWRAADSFTRLYYRAQGSPWRVQNWEAAVSGGGWEISDSRMAAQGALTVAAARLGADLYSVLRDVCGLHTSASRWSRDRNEHPGAGIPVLRIGLTLYANHLGLADE